MQPDSAFEKQCSPDPGPDIQAWRAAATDDWQLQDMTVLDLEIPGQTEEETQPSLCQLYEMSFNKYILLVCCALILFQELSTYTYHKCVGTLPQQP